MIELITYYQNFMVLLMMIMILKNVLLSMLLIIHMIRSIGCQLRGNFSEHVAYTLFYAKLSITRELDVANQQSSHSYRHLHVHHYPANYSQSHL